MSRIARLVLAAAGVLLAGTVAACGTVASSRVASDVPVPVFGFHGQLNSVAAVSASDAWAVGFSGGTVSGTGTLSGAGTLMLHWDGRTWSRVTSLGVLDGVPGMLTDVTAVSAGDAWAVGITGTSSVSEFGSEGKPLLLHWDGTRWSQAAGVPGRGPQASGTLTAASFSSAEDGWAIGTYLAGNKTWPLILHWDGTAWN